MIRDTPLFYIQRIDEERWTPETREYGTMTRVGEKILLFGGIKDEPRNDLNSLNIENLEW